MHSTPAQASDLVLEPASEWKVSERDTRCRLARTFGTGDDRTTLWVDQGSLTPAYNVTLIGQPLRNPFGAALSVQFAPQPEYSRAYLKAKSSKGRPVVMMYGARLVPTGIEIAGNAQPSDWVSKEAGENGYPRSVPTAPTAKQVDAVTQLRIGRALSRPLVLKTGSLSEPFKQLQACAEQVESEWATKASGGTPVLPKEQARWAAIISNNYPSRMLRAEQEASIMVRVTVGRNGRPSHCEVTEVVGPTSFNDTVCLLMMKHATFYPARNAAGDPVPGHYSNRVTFRLN